MSCRQTSLIFLPSVKITLHSKITENSVFPLLVFLRQKRNNISVVDLSEESRPIPNPVLTFEDAYANFRKMFIIIYKLSPKGYQ